MSHFSVLVIAGDHEAALQPFHEFECTGENDQYVQDIDRTAEAREQYGADTATRIKAPDGTLQSFFDDKGEWRPEFSQADVERIHGKTYYVPPGYEKVEVPISQVEKFADWAAGYYGWEIVRAGENIDLEGSHKYGYVQLDAAGEVVKCIDRTNPNKKWDWYQVGGRFGNRLALKDGRKVNQARAGDIDWDGMIAAKKKLAADEYDKIKAVIGDREIITWEQARAKVKAKEMTIDEARNLYNQQPILKELNDAGALDLWSGAETLSKVMATDRDVYIKNEGETNTTTWALLSAPIPLVMTGTWTERGKMGWFGMSDETDASTADYVANFLATVRALPADALLTVVDCHI